MAGKRMTRMGEAEALRRIENAARTTGEFKDVIEWYDKLDGNRERKERYHEITQGKYRLIYAEIRRRNRRCEARRKARQDGSARGYRYGNGGIIPPPLMLEYWREATRGDFISTIYDNADEIWQVFDDWQIGRLVKDLTMPLKEYEKIFFPQVKEDLLIRKGKALAWFLEDLIPTGEPLIGVGERDS